MKRVILGIAVAVCFHAHAGNGLPENEGRVGSCDTVRRFGNVGGDLIAMRKGVDENSIVLEVAGFGITLGQMDEGPGRLCKSRRVRYYILDNFEFGFNRLSGVDYGGYPSESGDFLDLQTSRSFHAAEDLAGIHVRLDRRRRILFSAGFSMTVDNYRLSDRSITLRNRDGRVVPEALGETAKKSGLTTLSLGVPLRVTLRPAQHLRISAAAYCDFAVWTDAVYAMPEPRVMQRLSGVNTFQFGVGASVAYCGIGVYARYGVTSYFKKSAGPVSHPLSLGICIFL